MSHLYHHDLTQWLQMSGEYISNIRPAEERAGWVAFLLDEIKAFIPPEEYVKMLTEIQTGLQQRLDEANSA